jgi:hypothetical protein
MSALVKMMRSLRFLSLVFFPQSRQSPESILLHYFTAYGIIALLARRYTELYSVNVARSPFRYRCWYLLLTGIYVGPRLLQWKNLP